VTAGAIDRSVLIRIPTFTSFSCLYTAHGTTPHGSLGSEQRLAERLQAFGTLIVGGGECLPCCCQDVAFGSRSTRRQSHLEGRELTFKMSGMEAPARCTRVRPGAAIHGRLLPSPSSGPLAFKRFALEVTWPAFRERRRIASATIMTR
jgi:hypothetical protein